MTRWEVRLTQPAEADLRQILLFTKRTFGVAQTSIYRSTLLAALNRLEDGPDVAGSTSHAEILPGLRSLHVARLKRRGRHLILYRPGAPESIDVLRILHDAMDLARHLPADFT